MSLTLTVTEQLAKANTKVELANKKPLVKAKLLEDKKDETEDEEKDEAEDEEEGEEDSKEQPAPTARTTRRSKALPVSPAAPTSKKVGCAI